MTQKMAAVLALLLIMGVLTGCWSRRELNDLAIAAAIGVDIKDNKYVLSAQIINPSAIAAKKGGGEATPVVTFRETGSTIMEGFRRMITQMPREVYFAHLRVLVISEELARNGIKEILDFFARYYEFRTDFYIILAKNTKAEQILNVLTPIEKIPGNELFSSLEKSQKVWAPTHAVKINELVSKLISSSNRAVLTGVEKIGDPVTGETLDNFKKSHLATKLQYKSIGVFKEDRLIGWLNEEESRGFNYIMNNVERTVAALPCPNGGKLSVNVVRSKTDVKGEMRNGNPQIRVKVYMERDIGEVACDIDLTKTETIDELDKAGDKLLKEVITKAIQAAQKKFKSDIFGFGEAIHRASPKDWKKLKPKWEQEFPNMPVHVETEVRTRRIGTETNSFIKLMQKEKID